MKSKYHLAYKKSIPLLSFHWVYCLLKLSTFLYLLHQAPLPSLCLYVRTLPEPSQPRYMPYNVYISKPGGPGSRKSNDHHLEVVFQPTNSREVEKQFFSLWKGINQIAKD